MIIISCPKCGTKYRVDDNKLAPVNLKLKCFKCGTIFLLKRKSAEKISEPLPAVATGKKILVAHSSSSMREMIGEILREAGFFPLYAKNGVEAISIMSDTHPEVVVVDVALPDVFGFEFPELIKADRRLQGIKVILVASIYDKTRYKRLPQSLYGADDFIEKHHIREGLIPKINKLIAVQEEIKEAASVPEKVQMGEKVEESIPLQMKEQDAKRMKEEEFLQSPADTQEIDKAKRLARIIISDIALYNQELIEQGIRQNTLEELLKNDLEEGRRLFAKRVPEHVRNQKDFLKESLEELINKKKKELGLVQ
ncbi:MAG: zinc-ribbon domain-containing protein [bacterium]